MLQRKKITLLLQSESCNPGHMLSSAFYALLMLKKDNEIRIRKNLSNSQTLQISIEFLFSIYTIIKQYHIYATEDHIVPVGKRL